MVHVSSKLNAMAYFFAPLLLEGHKRRAWTGWGCEMRSISLLLLRHSVVVILSESQVAA